MLYRLIRLNGSLSGHERNVLYWNRGDGTYADLSAVAGLDFPEDGRAFVTFDFDSDGDVDILLNNRNSPQLRLLRNDLPTSNRSVAFRLEGADSNRDGIGARLVLETVTGRRLTRSVRSGSGFRSQPSRTAHFGLGADERVSELAIFWPSGTVDRHQDLPSGHFVFLREGSKQVRTQPYGDPGTARSAGSAAASEPSASRSGLWLTEATPAPRLRGRTLEGGAFPAEDYRGRRILLNFWATWCAPCRVELAEFKEHRDRLEQVGLVPVLASVDEAGDEETVRRYVGENGLSFPVLLPDEQTVTAFDLLVRHVLDQSGELAIPTSFLIDESGRIVKLYFGRRPSNRSLSTRRTGREAKSSSWSGRCPSRGAPMSRVSRGIGFSSVTRMPRRACRRKRWRRWSMPPRPTPSTPRS